MKAHALFMATLIIIVHGLHFFDVTPSIGTWDVPMRISVIVVLYGICVLVQGIYTHRKKSTK